jgi:hypothetical protein
MEKVETKQTADYYMKDGKLVKKYLRSEERHRWVGKVKEKRCSKCRKWKAESDFYKNRQHIDGLAGWCKACANKATNKSHKKRRKAVGN